MADLVSPSAMSSPEPIPPPNDRRSSRASSNAGPTAPTLNVDTDVLVGGPPSSPSPLALRASNSPSSKRRKSRIAKLPPDVHQLEYTAECSDMLICLICVTPFHKPVQLACQHYFCRECLEHAWDAQKATQKTCPTCRGRVDTKKEPMPVPRSIENMLDELIVKCPNTKSGCDWVEHRVNVHDHVMLYCEYTPVECPHDTCRQPVSQKDYHKGCLHYAVNCDDCSASMMKRDLEDHQRTTCPHRATACPHCSDDVLRLDLKNHVKDTCPKVIVPCQGTIVGCSTTAERAELVEHEKACPMATMAPHFRDQQARIERNEARIEPLTRKVGILEDGLSNITSMLYPANDNESSYPVTDPLNPNSDAFPPAPLVPTPDFRLPPASYPPAPPSLDTSQTPYSAPTPPPFDSQVHHLLTLHSSLRDEVSRIANALTDHEGRTNLMIFNENQRVKEEMLHTNAAINSMRMQLHWLMSATLQQRTGSANSAGSSSSRAGGSTSNNASATQGSSSAIGSRSSGAGGTLPGPLRRLSDSTRQDTKL